MQILRRPLAPGETNHELLWLSVSSAALAFAATWFALGLPWPLCLFHALTGHPCLTCGATRSAIAFFHGQFISALQSNPLAFLFYCGLFLFNAYALGVCLLRVPRIRVAQLSVAEKKIIRGSTVAIFALNWLYLVIAHRSP